MIKTLYAVIFAFVAMMSTSSCAYAVRYDGPYEGRIIDADTGQPLEGVVVLGVWNTQIMTAGGATENFYDAKETMTDKDGKFFIQGLGLKIMTRVLPMDVLIFKAGYTVFGPMTWKELTRTVKREGNKPLLRLRRLTMKLRKEQGFPMEPMDVPQEKMKLMLEEINKERSAQGYSPL